MPMMQTVLGTLNENLSHARVRAFARDGGADDFAPGKPLAQALAKAGAGEGGPLYAAFLSFLQGMPPGMAEGLRATIYYALTTHTMTTFAWAPAYDFELDVWQAPDTEKTRGGITILVKSRYPDDPHPIQPAK